ncbi:pilus assembly protein [Sulfuricystis multivorans]|uniref:pilus assembly protein n=1 Tax=Sulfuricystis multivorans TaxID=2211108 RepID=UPI000F81F917|nr:PilC/PilY family type IV pilus protein [Sulfuricystis multivorans]
MNSFRFLPLVFCLGLPAWHSWATPTDISSGPLITPTASPVKPNLMFLLDDSGSMRFDYLPDWLGYSDYNYCKNSTGETGTKCCRQPSSNSSAWVCLPQNSSGNNIDTVYSGGTNQRGMPPFLTHTTWLLKVPSAGGGTHDEIVNGGFNSVYYNPTIEYRPPVNADGTSRASYSGNGTTPWDAYGVMYGAAGIDLRTEFPDTEWCTNTSYTDCLRADNYLVPGTIAGKNYTTMHAVRATGSGKFVTGTPQAPTIDTNRDAGPHYYVMIPGEFCTNRKLTNCVASWVPTTVGGVAYNYPAALRWCNNTRGRDRLVDGGVAAATDRCQALKNGTFRYPRYPTLRVSTTGPTYAPGRFMRIDIVSGKASYGNLCVAATGTVTERFGPCNAGEFAALDRSGRSDCTNQPTCSYSEELSNFANWFAWYRSRIQSTKTAISIAFQSVDDRFRVGFMTINGNTTGNRDLINIADFNFVPGPSGHKQDWYTRLFAIRPSGGTPLREALSRVGRYFAKSSGLAGATDPIQYSCQKNFSIVTTDGYWNGAGGVRLNGSGIGNEDSSGMVIGGVGQGDMTASPPVPPIPFADGWSGTLADVAAYYYKTDLRDSSLNNCTGALGVSGGSVCTDNVATRSGVDMNTAQHMVTYGVSLGVDGLMQYRADYKTPSGDPTTDPTDTDDYDAVSFRVNASTANAVNGICPWQTSGSCNWPQPSADNQANIDDLWHAAVNGHGSYLLAKNPLTLSRGLRDIINDIWVDDGSNAAATTSNPNVTAGDNFLFSSKYWTQKWVGELVRESINTINGTIFTGSEDWQAHTLLDAASWSARSILTFRVGGGSPRAFTYATLNPGACNPPASEQGCFDQSWIAGGLAQYCAIGPLCLSAADQAAAAGQPLVDYLRGDKSHEDTTNTTGYFRKRDGRMGDIVNAEAVYVGKYLYDYGSAVGYPARNTLRPDPTLYVAANDGMLHAFNASGASSGGGQERWAYIPSMVIRDLYRLADKDYDTKHRYFVDGSPVVMDVKDGGVWKTILVGGLAGGGPGYYALDITNQTAPEVLWEFRQKPGCTASTPAGAARYASSGIARMIEDCDLGYSFGNPVITKLPNGQWVVMVTSGYNNHVNGDGRGYLYVLDAMTGAVIYKVSTGAGSTATPSGLARIAAWADDPLKDNTTKYVYGGDLLGKLWKFDFTGGGAPTVSLLYDAGPNQPITARPELGEVTKTNTSVKKRVVFFPTGRLLGNSDLANTQSQSFYGIWDWLGGSTPANGLVNVPVSSGGAGRTGTIYDINGDGNPDSVFDDDNNLGWKLDFPDAGERGVTDPMLVLGTLVFSTTKPGTPDPCNASGFTSWVYNIDFLSGHVVFVPGTSNTQIAVQYSGAATRANIFTLPGGQVKSIIRLTDQNVTNQINDVRIKSKLKRISWRELTK